MSTRIVYSYEYKPIRESTQLNSLLSKVNLPRIDHSSSGSNAICTGMILAEASLASLMIFSQLSPTRSLSHSPIWQSRRGTGQIAMAHPPLKCIAIFLVWCGKRIGESGISANLFWRSAIWGNLSELCRLVTNLTSTPVWLLASWSIWNATMLSKVVGWLAAYMAQPWTSHWQKVSTPETILPQIIGMILMRSSCDWICASDSWVRASTCASCCW